LKAVHSVNNVIAEEVIGMDVMDQSGIDKKIDRPRWYKSKEQTGLLNTINY
jgi:enolase